MMRRVVVGLIVGTVAATSQAGDGGDLSVRLMTQHEVAFLHGPGATYDQVSRPFVYLPRFEMQLAYGLTHWLEVFVGGSLSLPRDVISHGAQVQGVRGQLRSTYQGFLLPFGLAAKWDRGTGYSWALSASLGPSLTHWSHKELRQNRGIYPIVETQAWYRDWLAQGAILGQWRPSNWFGLSGGPYIRQTTGGDTHLGLTVNLEFLAGIGPSW